MTRERKKERERNHTIEDKAVGELPSETGRGAERVRRVSKAVFHMENANENIGKLQSPPQLSGAYKAL